MRLAIFPAAGGLGGATLTHLLDTCQFDPSSLVLLSRNPSKLSLEKSKGVETRQADFDAPESFESVFKDVDALNLISYPSFTHHHRVKVSPKSGIS